jgi:FecR protein
MAFFRFRTFFFVLALSMVGGSLFAQGIVTVKTSRDLEATGTVVEENGEKIVVETEKYGVLHFQKIKLKTITRYPPKGTFNNDPFGGGNAGGGFGGDPFGADPFSGGAPQNPLDAPPSGGSPFGGDPFSSAPPTGGTSPFDSGAAAPDPFSSAPVAGGGSPFGGGAPAQAPVANAGSPFDSGTAAPDPFSSAPPAVAGDGNPFGGGAPAPSNTSNSGSGFKGFGVPLDQVNLGQQPAAGGSPFGGGAANPTAPSNPFDSGSDTPSSSPSPFDGGGGNDPFSLYVPNQKTFPGSLPGAGSCYEETNIFLAANSTRFDFGDNDKSVQDDVVAPPSLPKLPKMKTRTQLPEVSEGFDAVLFGIDEENAVEVKVATEEQWGMANSDTQLATGNEVRTNQTRSSRMLLRGKHDELRLPQESHLVLERLSDDSEEVVINLQAGSVWSEVTPRNQPDAFKVRTPELTAGVRGTNFRVDRLNGASKVSVFSGIVRVTANLTGIGVTLKENQSAVVNIHGQILDILSVPVDEQKIYGEWEQWAMETTLAPGALGAMTVTGSLAQTVAQDNARWEAQMQEYMRNTAEVKYMDKLDEYAAAFLRYAQDTGKVPAEDEAWINMKIDPGIEGWSGPYVDGPVPPLDPWKKPLKYKLYKSPVGNTYGRVYSFWEDRRDQGGANATLDRASLVRFFTIEGVEFPEMKEEDTKD